MSSDLQNTPVAQGSSTPAATGNSAADTAQSVATSVINSASSAVTSVQNSETVQRIANGPVAANVKAEANKTSTEFSNLANSRSTPDKPAATGQPLTHYHSLFYNLLSWENPRATGIAFVSSIIFIFLARYLSIIPYILKLTFFTLGITASLEIAGKTLFNSGLATSMRPRKYYTISKEALESTVQDVEQLVNFFVIEAQRILFAENIFVTVAAFATALVSYFLIKVVPFWGMCLIGTSVVFLAPLVYISNKETIDSFLNETSEIASRQASQLREITAQHTGAAAESVKGLTNQYTSKAQELIGSRRDPGPTASHSVSTSSTLPTPPKTEPLPTAPKVEPFSGSTAPGSTTGGQSYGSAEQAYNRNFKDTADGADKVISTN